MSSIFISYRRTGTSGYCGLLQDGLRDHFGRDRVFRDIDSIRPGSDFADVVENAVSEAGVVLALIGSNWLDARNEAGGRRLDEPDDFVRLEIESALKHRIVVVPVLVEGARMPSPGELPPSISRLGRSQAIALSDERWEYDVGRLVAVLEELLPAPAHTAGQDPVSAGAAGAGTPTASPTDEAATTPEAPAPPQGPVARVDRKRVLVGSAAIGIVVLLLTIVMLTGNSDSGDQAQPTEPDVVDEEVAAASDTDCAEEASFRSLDGETPTTLTFVNDTAGPVDVYWLDGEGARELYIEELAAGSSQEQETFAEHYWLVADPEGNCMAIYEGTSSSAVIVEPSP